MNKDSTVKLYGLERPPMATKAIVTIPSENFPDVEIVADVELTDWSFEDGAWNYPTIRHLKTSVRFPGSDKIDPDGLVTCAVNRGIAHAIDYAVSSWIDGDGGLSHDDVMEGAAA
jgi:hypothetical protein